MEKPYLLLLAGSKKRVRCWLEHVQNSKKIATQAEHISDTFEYF